uniref:Uncharacterized protein n=1 Tax=Aegilops tauschii TaxID=37682 RepID=M8BY39_AEGTA
MDLMFDDRHVTGAESAIPGEIPLDKEDVRDDSDEEVIKAKPKKQRKTKSCKDDFSALDEKNPFVRMYKKASDAICVTAESIKEASSSSKAHPPPSPPVAPAPPPPVGPSMNEAMEMTDGIDNRGGDDDDANIKTVQLQNLLKLSTDLATLGQMAMHYRKSRLNKQRRQPMRIAVQTGYYVSRRAHLGHTM